MTPVSIEAERSVIYCMLTSEVCAMRGLAELDERDFFNDKFRTVFLTAKKLASCGKKIDAETVIIADESTATAVVETMGWYASSGNFEDYVDGLRNARQRRELISSCQSIIKSAEANEDGYLEMAQKSIADVTAIGNGGVEMVGDAAIEAITTVSGNKMGKRTGFESLDMLINGMGKGKLTVVAGRPGMGKSAFAMNIAINMARNDVVAVFSLEMTREELLQRAAYSLSLCGQQDVLRGDESKIAKLIEAGAEISKMKLYIDERAALTAEQIKATCYRIKQRSGLDLVIVDYLQLMQTKTRKNGTREQEIAELSRGMKLLAREMDCAVILVSQLSRATEQRSDKKPILSDLRESGAIEQDADTVIFMYRPFVYDEKADPREAYALVEKNRGGATGAVRLNWDGRWFRFTSNYGGK